MTVGITSFNAANTIEAAVASALEQTLKPLEVIIVDDCSTDNSSGILKSLASLHEAVKIFSNFKNLGVAQTRNRILELAKGEFVAFFDDDDVSLPERLEKQLARILAYEQEYASRAMVLCHAARLVKYPDGSEQVQPTIGQRENCIAPHGLAVAKRAVLGTPLKDAYGSCPTCSQMARLSTYRSVRGFDPNFRRGEDSDLLVRLAKAGGHIVGIAEPLVIQTMTKTSEKSLAAERHYALMFLEKHRDVADSEGLYEFCHQWLIIKYTWLEQEWQKFALRLLVVSIRYPLATLNRFTLSTRNFAINRSFSQFHRSVNSSDD